MQDVNELQKILDVIKSCKDLGVSEISFSIKFNSPSSDSLSVTNLQNKHESVESVEEKKPEVPEEMLLGEF